MRKYLGYNTIEYRLCGYSIINKSYNDSWDKAQNAMLRHSKGKRRGEKKDLKKAVRYLSLFSFLFLNDVT